jgi:acyl-coenzyme A synthetase/AMP-(fatty) acid ligase
MNLIDMIYFWGRTLPERPAILQPDMILSYRALTEAIEKAAQYFVWNIRDTTKPVAVSINSNPRMLIATFGLLRANFSVIVAGPKDLPLIGADESPFVIMERGGGSPGPQKCLYFDDGWISGTGAIPLGPLPSQQQHGNDIEISFFTSGTTGRPKRIVRTQRAFDQRILFNSNAAFVNYERALLVTGVGNSMGFTRAYEALYTGKTICFAPIGEPMLRLANTFDVDIIYASPQQALQLAELQQKVANYPLAALKAIMLGGSILSTDGITRIQNYLCRNIILTYSSTEAGVVATAPYDMIAQIPKAVGFIVPGANVQIVDAAENVLPSGREGFVRLRTEQYIANFGIEDPNKWYYPGDVGWVTDEGALCIVGRKDGVLNRGGLKFSVEELEGFMRQGPGIRDAGACGVMTAAGFEEVWLALVLDPAADLAALRQQIEGSAEFAGQIDKIFVVEDIPRGQLGKVQREELKKMLQGINEQAAG